MLAAVVLTHALFWSARIARERVRWIWRMTVPTMIMIAVLWVIFYRDTRSPWLTWWILQIGPHNVAEGTAIALRVGALAFVMFAWLFTTDQVTLVLGFQSLGLPFEWGLTLAIALRYLPTMANVFRMISEAQQARALNLSHRNPLLRGRAYLPIAVAMLITALRTAQSLSHALESRALGATRQRTYLHRLHLRATDLIWLVFILSGTGLLLWARFAWQFGSQPLEGCLLLR